MVLQKQHGTSSAKVKENVDVTESAKDREKITKKNKEDYRKKFTSIYKRYNAVRNDLCEDGSGKDFLSLPLVRDEIGKSLKRYISSEAVKGYDAAIKEAKKQPNIEPQIGSLELHSGTDCRHSDLFIFLAPVQVQILIEKFTDQKFSFLVYFHNRHYID